MDNNSEYIKASEAKDKYFWKIDKNDFRNQIKNYNFLKITKSYRGQTVLIFTILIILSIILGVFNIVNLQDALLALIIYIPLLIFVYKGHRWAILLLMLLFTFSSFGQFLVNGKVNFILWIAIMFYLYKTLKNENERKRKPSSISDTFQITNKADLVTKSEKLVSKKNWKKFQLVENIFGFGIVTVFSLMLAYLLTLLLLNIENLYAQIKNSGEIYFLSDGFTKYGIQSWFLSVVILMAMGGIIFKPIAKKVCNNDVEFETFYLKRYERNGKMISAQIASVFAIFAVPLFIITTILGVDCYTKITSNSIVDNNYFGLGEKEYPFKNIVKIFYANSYQNKISKEIESTTSRYVVLFKNGFTWSSVNFREHGTPKEKEIINYISERSSIPIGKGILNIDDSIK
jgi:hypothetical protein